MPDWKSMLDLAVSGNVSDEQLSPYLRLLSLPLINRWQEKTVYIDWQPSAESHQDSGMVFGGYISALVDYAAGSAMLTILEDTELFFTKKLEVEFKRPIRLNRLTIKAEVVEQQDINVKVLVSFINAKGDVHAIGHVYQTIFS